MHDGAKNSDQRLAYCNWMGTELRQLSNDAFENFKVETFSPMRMPHVQEVQPTITNPPPGHLSPPLGPRAHFPCLSLLQPHQQKECYSRHFTSCNNMYMNKGHFISSSFLSNNTSHMLHHQSPPPPPPPPVPSTLEGPSAFDP